MRYVVTLTTFLHAISPTMLLLLSFFPDLRCAIFRHPDTLIGMQDYLSRHGFYEFLRRYCSFSNVHGDVARPVFFLIPLCWDGRSKSYMKANSKLLPLYIDIFLSCTRESKKKRKRKHMTWTWTWTWPFMTAFEENTRTYRNHVQDVHMFGHDRYIVLIHSSVYGIRTRNKKRSSRTKEKKKGEEKGWIRIQKLDWVTSLSARETVGH